MHGQIDDIELSRTQRADCPVQTVTLLHWAKQKADYKCALRDQRITGLECRPAAFTAQPAAGETGVPFSVDVAYEPSSLNDAISDIISIASPVGGTYDIPVTVR